MMNSDNRDMNDSMSCKRVYTSHVLLILLLRMYCSLVYTE